MNCLELEALALKEETESSHSSSISDMRRSNSLGDASPSRFVNAFQSAHVVQPSGPQVGLRAQVRREQIRRERRNIPQRLMEVCTSLFLKHFTTNGMELIFCS